MNSLLEFRVLSALNVLKCRRMNKKFLNSTSYSYRFSRSIINKLFHRQDEKSAESPTQDFNSDSLIGRDLVSLRDFEKEGIHQILWTAKDLKMRMEDDGAPCQLLQGKTAVMLSDKEDLTTRLSAELGISKLGGCVANYQTQDLSDIKQAGRLLSSLSDLIIMGGDHTKIPLMADESNVPVVTGLSSLLHPLQVLTYFLTIQDFFGFLRGAKIAFVGGGGPTLNSLLFGCAKLGIDLSTATPPGLEPDIDVMLDAVEIANKTGATFQLGDDPLKAVYRADVIITDSMGCPDGGVEAKYLINRKMLTEAGGTWIFLRNLDVNSNKPLNVTEDILYGEESMVREAVKNRLWTTMAVMLHLLAPYQPIIDKPKFVRG